MFLWFVIISLAFLGGNLAAIDYEVPPAQFVIYHPRGFEVSIPAETDVTLFAFHGKLNEEFDGRESGSWARDVTKVRNGRYTFRDRETKLKIGDVIYYWTYVIYRGLGYVNEDVSYTVTGFNTTNVPSSVTPPLVSSSTVLPGNKPQDCVTSMTTVNGQAQCQGALIFEDNFDELNANKWRKEKRFSRDPDYEFNIYTDTVDTVTTRNGNLLISAVRTETLFQKPLDSIVLNFGVECTGELGTEECMTIPKSPVITAPVSTARINTAKSFNFRYGKIEIRAILPSADWIFPQLFLESSANFYGKQNLASGQMRIAFLKGQSGPLSGGVLLGDRDPFRLLQMCTSPSTQRWSEDFHTYALHWHPNKITVSVDGQVYCTIDPDGGFHTLADSRGNKVEAAALWRSQGVMAPFDKEFYLTLGLGVGGFNDFSDESYKYKPWRNYDIQAMRSLWTAMSSTDWPSDKSQLQVDYVRVYAL